MAFISIAAACTRPYLTWSPREPLSARRGRLAVVVDDQRAGERRLIGRAFGFGGVPRDIMLEGGEVAARIAQLTREAAMTAGLGILGGGVADPPTARMQIDVRSLACEGLGMKAHADLALAFSITAPDGALRMGPVPIATHGRGRGCEDALGQALDELLDELAAKLVEGPVHDAVLEETTTLPDEPLCGPDEA